MKIGFTKMKSDNQIFLTPEDDEDMWNIYNLIALDDILSSQTIRKVKCDSNANSERSNFHSKSIKLYISINIKTIDYDIEANIIRVNGTNCTQNEYIKLGAYHSVVIEPNKMIKLKKESWDEVDHELLNQIKDSNSKFSIGAIVLEEGVAHLCLVSFSSCILLHKITQNIPKKHKIFQGKYSEALNQFYSSITDQILRLYDIKKLKCLVLASPGFFNSHLLQFIKENATSCDRKKILHENLHKFLLVHSFDGYLDSLNTVLKDPKVINEIADFGISQELRYFQQFQTQLYEDEYKAVYGHNHLKYCIDNYGPSCIKVLMILDILYRSKSLEERIKYSHLCKDLKHLKSTKFIIFSSRGQSGKELANLGGVAAILHYPIHDIDNIDM